MEVDKDKLKRAKELASKKQILKFDDVSDEEKEDMKRRLQEANLPEKLQAIWKDWQEGRTGAAESLYKLVLAVLRLPYRATLDKRLKDLEDKH